MKKIVDFSCKLFTAGVISSVFAAFFATTFNAFLVFAFCGGMVLCVLFGMFD